MDISLAEAGKFGTATHSTAKGFSVGVAVQRSDRPVAQSYAPDINLAGVDLNLLVALEVLLARCNVTHAANAVGLSQPAMSRALSRLRGMFNDDLLVRTSAGFVRTIRGEQLHDSLPATLDAVRKIISRRTAGSEGWKTAFRMAMADHQALVLLHNIWGQLNTKSMKTETVVEPLTTNLWKRLENGEVEVAIGQVSDAPQGFFRRTLYKDDYVCLVRRGHAALNEVVTLSHFCDLQHAVIAPGHDAERSFVSEALANVPLRNRSILSPNTMGTAMAVAESDAVLTAPRRVATKLASLLPLAMFEMPVEVPPYEVMLLWHERSHNSAEHSMMRSQIAAAARLGVTAQAQFRES